MTAVHWREYGWSGSAVCWHPLWMPVGRGPSSDLYAALADRYGRTAWSMVADPSTVGIGLAVEAIVGDGSYNPSRHEPWMVAEMFSRPGARVWTEDVELMPRRSHVEPLEGGCLCLASGCQPLECWTVSRCVHCGSRDRSRWPECTSCQRMSRRPITRAELVERVGERPGLRRAT